MKNVKNAFSWLALSVMVLALVFTGCPDPSGSVDTPTGEETDTRKYLSAGDEVTVNVGESLTVYVQGKTSVDDFECEGITITHKDGDAFEIKAAETMTDATVSVNFNDGTDEDEGIEVTVYVYDPYFTLNITLDDAVAEKAASISVYAEGKEDGESTAALSQTVEATYTAGKTSATAKLAKDKANSYKYFNNIVVTVKDSEDSEIAVETNPVYFCYTDTKFTGITVSAAKDSKTFTINFEGFTIVGGSVTGLKYSTVWASSPSGWEEDTTFTPAVKVASDGTSATFEVANTIEFYIDWTAVVVKDSSDAKVEISSGNTNPKAEGTWYSFAGDVWSNTLTHVSGEYVNLCTAQAWSNSDPSGDVYVSVLDASKFTSLSISTLRVRITLTTDTWANASSADAWATATYANTSWSADANAHEVIITSTDFINALSTNGLYVATSAGSAGTVTVDYIAK